MLFPIARLPPRLSHSRQTLSLSYVNSFWNVKHGLCLIRFEPNPTCDGIESYLSLPVSFSLCMHNTIMLVPWKGCSVCHAIWVKLFLVDPFRSTWTSQSDNCSTSLIGEHKLSSNASYNARIHKLLRKLYHVMVKEDEKRTSYHSRPTGNPNKLIIPRRESKHMRPSATEITKMKTAFNPILQCAPPSRIVCSPRRWNEDVFHGIETCLID